MRPARSFVLFGLLGTLYSGQLGMIRAEDADRFRPYLRFHSGDIEPRWNVDDHWSFGLGANFNRYVGAELAFDYFSRDWGSPETVGEVSVYSLMPELRLRYPVLKDRLVPYLVGGVGGAWMQNKDLRPNYLGHAVDLEGYALAYALGGGLEYFIADNVTFGVEGRYLWVNSRDGKVDGVPQAVDVSSPFFTFGLRVYFDENTPRPLATASAEEVNRFYFGLRLGVNVLTDGDWFRGVRWEPEQAAWGGVASQTGGLALGADFGTNLGAELTFDHINHLVTVAGLGETTEYGQGWVLANLRVRYPLGRWVPYGLIGVGGCYTEFKDQKLGSLGYHNDGNRLHPAVGAGLGAEYFIVRNFSFNVDARWAYSWDHEYEIQGLLARGSGDLSYFAATVGFRVYLFDF
jgi:opacity protein-like surface antigen